MSRAYVAPKSMSILWPPGLSDPFQLSEGQYFTFFKVKSREYWPVGPSST